MRPSVQRLEISVNGHDEVQSVRRKKVCAECKNEFDLNQFYLDKEGRPGAYCRSCKKKLNQIWRAKRAGKTVPTSSPTPKPVIVAPSKPTNLMSLIEMAVTELSPEERQTLGRVLLAWDAEKR